MIVCILKLDPPYEERQIDNFFLTLSNFRVILRFGGNEMIFFRNFGYERAFPRSLDRKKSSSPSSRRIIIYPKFLILPIVYFYNLF